MFPDENRYKDEYKDYEKAKLLPVDPPEEQLKRAKEAFSNLSKLIQNEIMPMVEYLCKNLGSILKRVVDIYPNKRVIYLATHGKHRVRKKNINRIKKWFEREAKNEDR